MPRPSAIPAVALNISAQTPQKATLSFRRYASSATQSLLKTFSSPNHHLSDLIAFFLLSSPDLSSSASYNDEVSPETDNIISKASLSLSSRTRLQTVGPRDSKAYLSLNVGPNLFFFPFQNGAIEKELHNFGRERLR